jgi:alpha-ketoglutarate-dependent taurine dioxygenase
MLNPKPLNHASGIFDNFAADYQHISAKPLAAAMGAEIVDVDCAQVSDEQFAEIEHALFRHKMIYFRGQQHMSHADQSAFSRRFGPFAEDAYTKGVDGYPEVQPIIKEADHRTGHLFGTGWHTDSPFLPEPPAISTLRSIEIPPFGGDTMWANAALAYAALSEVMKAMLAPLKVHMSLEPVLTSAQANGVPGDDPVGRLAQTAGQALVPEVLEKVKGSFHPLVRTHPKSAEKSLYCDMAYTVGIEGMKSEESAPLLKYLVEHITQPAFTCRLRWEPGMFVLWDNRLCVHSAFNDYDGHRREMYRTTIAGEAPE